MIGFWSKKLKILPWNVFSSGNFQLTFKDTLHKFFCELILSFFFTLKHQKVYITASKECKKNTTSNPSVLFIGATANSIIKTNYSVWTTTQNINLCGGRPKLSTIGHCLSTKIWFLVKGCKGFDSKDHVLITEGQPTEQQGQRGACPGWLTWEFLARKTWRVHENFYHITLVKHKQTLNQIINCTV